MKTSKTSLTGIIVLLFAISGLLLTCNVGLGDSVDTKAPTLSISYPPVQSVIRNAFTMSGKASDDVSLASIDVIVKDTVSGSVVATYKGSIEKTKKTWMVAINEKDANEKYAIPDGTYELTVTATDAAGRKTVATTTYEIDNTAPVIVLNRPGTAGPVNGATPEVYGSELKLTGSANDDHSIELLTFTVFSTDGTQVGSPITYTNISGVGMEIVLAKYFSDPTTPEETAQTALYKSIWNSDVGGDQNFYCTVDVSDSAREFDPPSAAMGNSRGNTSAFYFLYDDIYSTIFDESGYGMTMKDLTKVYNGTYVGSVATAQIVEYLDTKKKSSTAWSTSAATFSLNPDNSPTYKVSGYSPVSATKNLSSYRVSNDSKITVSIQAGRDAVPLLSDTFKITLDPCDIYGVPTVPDTTDNIVLMNTVAELGADAARIEARKALITKTGNDYNITLGIGTLVTGRYYLVVAEGYDQSNYPVSGKNGKYGFFVISSGAPPIITLNGSCPTNLSYSTSPTSSWSGNVTFDEAYQNFTATFAVYNELTSAVHLASGALTCAIADGATANVKDWSFSADANLAGATSGLYRAELSIRAFDTNGTESVVTKTIYIDREAPKLSSFSFSPTAQDASDITVANGIVTVEAVFTDNDQLASGTYYVNGTARASTTSLPKATISVDTRSYSNADNPLMRFTLVDRAGNSVDITQPILIDQTTDVPNIAFNNIDASKTTVAGAADNIIYGTSISGNITDDDGVLESGIVITIENDNGTPTAPAIVSPVISGVEKSRVFTQSISNLTDGKYRITVVATDRALGVSKSIGPVYFSFDNTPPTVTSTTPPPANTRDRFDLSGLASDGNSLKAAEFVTITQSKDSGPAEAVPGIVLTGAGTGNGTWSVADLPRIPGSMATPVTETSASDGEYMYTITATDIAGKSKQLTYTVRFDRTPGTTTFTVPGTVGSAPTFSGNANDTGSGPKVVFFNFDDGSTWTTAGGTNPWNATVAMSGTEGPRTLYVQVEDNAGNRSGSITQAFTYDTAKPTLSVDGASSRNANDVFQITGAATDNYGIGSVTVTQNGTVISTNGPAYGGSPQARTWTLANLPRDPGTIGAALLADGTFTYQIYSTDLASKTSNTATVTVTVDRTPPNVNAVTAPASGQTGIDAIGGESYLFRGNASDETTGVGVAKIWYTIDKNLVAPAIDVGNTPDMHGYTEVATSGNWNFTKTIPGELAQGIGYYIHVLAEDRSGNRTATADATNVRFDVDQADPVAGETIIGSSSVVDRKATFSLTGSATDTHGISTVTITQKLDSGTAIDITSNGPTLIGPTTSRTWTLENLPRGNTVATIGNTVTTNGTYEYVITATDLAGKPHSITRRIRFDNVGPTVTVLAPSSGSWANSLNVPVNGIASDLTAVATVYYHETAAGVMIAPTVPADPSDPDNWTGAGWTDANGTNSWDFTLTEASEGLKKVWIAAVDTAANASVPQALPFGADTATPGLTSNTPDANTRILFNLSGGATDSNALAAASFVTITQRKGAGSAETVPGLVLTGAGTASGTWSVTGLPRIPGTMASSVPLTSASDGVYEYVITATDAAGKISQKTLTVRFDITAPTPTVTAPADAGLVGSSYTFIGSSSDTGGSGVKTVFYNFDGGATWNTASGSAPWTSTIVMSGTEGSRTLYVQVEDNAGNRSGSVTRDFIYDTAVPTVGIDAMASTNVKNVFPISGTATDNYGVGTNIDSVVVTQKFNTDPAVEISVNRPTYGGTHQARTWTLANLPRDPADIGTDSLVDGTYLYEVTAKDLAGKSSLIASVTVKVDTSAPNVNSITAPESGQTGKNAIGGTSYLFRGNAQDGTGGVGVAKIWYAIDKNATAPTITTTPAAAGYTEVATGGSWSFSKIIPADLAEGMGYYLHVLAEDSSGNRTATTDATNVQFDVDQADPVAGETIIGSSSVVDRKATFSLTGSAKDTHGISTVTITQKLDDGAALDITSNGPTLIGLTTNRTWTLENLPRGNAAGTIGTTVSTNGVYEYVITATDLAGKPHSITRRIRFDNVGPTVTVLAPSTNGWANSLAVPVNGIASDLTAVATVYYHETAAGVVVAPAVPSDPSVAGNWTGAGVGGGWTAAIGANSWDFTLTEASEGLKKVWIAAVDTAANASVPQALPFGVDMATPGLTSNTPEANTRVLFNLSGDATDSNALATSSAERVTITQRKGTGTVYDIPSADITIGGTIQSGTWSVTGLPRVPGTMTSSVPETSASDGEYEYVITATDAAGKTRQKTVTVRFDRTDPSMDINTDLSFDWWATASLPLAGDCSDGGSTIQSVEYSLNSGSTWAALSFTTTGWNGTIPVSDGANVIRLRITDKAQNTTVLADEQVDVDLVSPTLNITSPTEIQRFRAGVAIPANFTASDTLGGSGIDYVQVTKIGATTLTTPVAATHGAGDTYTVNILGTTIAGCGLTDGGQYTVTVTATEVSDRTSTATFSFIYDTSDPLVSFTAPTVPSSVASISDTFNRDVTVSGTASDTQMLKPDDPDGDNDPVKLEIVNASGAVLKLLETFEGAAANSWTYPLNTITYGTTAYGTGSPYGVDLILRVTAVDAAGNDSYVERTITVNQDSDLPVVKLSNVNLSLVPASMTTLKMVGTVYGTVTDDDGIKEFYITEDAVDPIDWGTALTLSGGTWSRNSSSDDGEKTLYFRVIDGKDREFITNATGGNPEPRTQYESTYGADVVKYKVDQITPEIGSKIYADRTSTFTLADKVELTNNMVFGGSVNTFRVGLTATDVNGIDATKVKVTIPGATGGNGLTADEFIMTGTYENGPEIEATVIKKGGEYQIISGTGFASLGASGDTAGITFSASRDGTAADTGKMVRQLMYVTDIAAANLINVSTIATEQYIPMTFEVYDTSGLKNAATRTILVDNVAPSLTHASPLNNDTVNGDIEIKGNADDGYGSGIQSVKYQIGKGWDHTLASIKWKSVSNGTLTWRIDVKGAGTNIDSYANDTDGTAVTTVPTDPEYGLYYVPIVVRVEDKAGNVYVGPLADPAVNYVLKVNPDGDKPWVQLVYPAPSIESTTMGGTIRISGSAGDDDGVASVWMQIDTDNSGACDAGDDSYGPDDIDWFNTDLGHQVSGNVSWYMTINNKQEFNPSDTAIDLDEIKAGFRYEIVKPSVTPSAAELATWHSLGVDSEVTAEDIMSKTISFTAARDGTLGDGSGTVLALIKRIRFRIRAADVTKDAGGLPKPVYGIWSNWYTIDVDKNMPKIGSSDAVAFENAAGTVSRVYKSGMWVAGDWIMTGSVEDESGIDNIIVSGAVSGNLEDDSTWFEEVDITPADLTDEKFNYKLKIPVDTSTLSASQKTLTITLTVTDKSSPQMTKTETYTINYDNEKPTALSYSGVVPVRQSDRTYKVFGKATEDKSGLERVAFFFRRATGAGDERYYDPGVSDPSVAEVRVIEKTAASVTMEDGLPWISFTDSSRTDDHSFNYGSSVYSESIRVGGLVKIGGFIRRITGVSGSVVTWEDSVDKTAYTTAKFAIAQVIDNTTTETAVWNAGYTQITSITNDDYDKMIEVLKSEGGLYDWEANINSKNIPDGPIDICYVAYDAAGNYETKTVTTDVLNKPPRIAKVILGTDLDDDLNTSDSGETTEYSALDGLGAITQFPRIASDAFIAKGTTTVDIEIVDGTASDKMNGNLYYTYADQAYTASGAVETPVTGSGAALHDFIIWTAGPTRTAYLPTLSVATLELIEGTNASVQRNLVFTVWDSTDARTAGTSSQYTVLTVPLTVDVIDGKHPDVTINPFYWTDAEHNSLYDCDPYSGTTHVNEGHIDLTGDLDTSAGKFDSTTALKDTDPKVSGRVRITGTAFDEKRLTRLWMYIGNGADNVDRFAFTNYGGTPTNQFNTTGDSALETLPGTYTLMATYNTTTHAWEAVRTGVATAAEGWVFKATDEFFTQSGHKVNWTLDWDSSKLPGMAATNRQIHILAEDKATTTANASAVGSALVSGMYQVDVVPYIDSMNRTGTAPGPMAIRSKLGRYVFRRGDEITVTGFNLYNSATPATTLTIGGATATITGASSNSKLLRTSIPEAGTAYASSGNVVVTVSTVENVNNLNNNTVPYNKDSTIAYASDGSEFWNDDSKVHVWISNDNQSTANYGYFPQTGDSVYPAMTYATGGALTDVTNSGKLFASWTNYSDAETYYIDNAGGTRTTICHFGDPPEHTDIAWSTINGAGNPVIAYNANVSAGGNFTTSASGGVHLYAYNAPTNTISGSWNNQTYRMYRLEMMYHDEALMQFTNQRVATAANGHYVTYFDTDTKSLKYAYIANGAGQADDVEATPWVNIAGGSDGDDTQIVANRPAGDVAGEYSAVAVDTTLGFPVVAYYDAKLKTVRIAYSSTLTGLAAANWTIQDAIATTDLKRDYSGKYLSMKIDSSGNLHIAYLRISTGDLMYVKCDRITPIAGVPQGFTQGTSEIIDSIGSVGQDADISLDSSGRPYISYLDASNFDSFDGLKMAYYNGTAWDYMTVPVHTTVEQCRTSVEYNKSVGALNGAQASTAINCWSAAVGYSSDDFYRVAYYVFGN